MQNKIILSSLPWKKTIAAMKKKRLQPAIFRESDLAFVIRDLVLWFLAYLLNFWQWNFFDFFSTITRIFLSLTYICEVNKHKTPDKCWTTCLIWKLISYRIRILRPILPYNRLFNDIPHGGCYPYTGGGRSKNVCGGRREVPSAHSPWI